jgi:hypothetical protein
VSDGSTDPLLKAEEGEAPAEKVDRKSLIMSIIMLVISLPALVGS